MILGKTTTPQTQTMNFTCDERRSTALDLINQKSTLTFEKPWIVNSFINLVKLFDLISDLLYCVTTLKVAICQKDITQISDN